MTVQISWLRNSKSVSQPCSNTLAQENQMQVQQVMTQDPACCTPNTKLQAGASLMLQNDCGAIPVVDDANTKHLIGILTDRDIVCRELAKGLNPLEFTANDCMTRQPATVTPDT